VAVDRIIEGIHIAIDLFERSRASVPAVGGIDAQPDASAATSTGANRQVRARANAGGEAGGLTSASKLPSSQKKNRIGHQSYFFLSAFLSLLPLGSLLPLLSSLPSAALLYNICPIRFSSTTAEWRHLITSPARDSCRRRRARDQGIDRPADLR